MPGLIVNGFNVGTDLSGAVSDVLGDIFTFEDLGHIIEFDSAAEDSPLKVVPIDNGGIPVFQTIWSGVSGNMTFVRSGPAFNRLIIDLMAGYHFTGIIPQFSITVNVMNRDGSIDEYLYSGVQFSKPSFGNYRGVKEVDMKVGFVAAMLQTTGSAISFLTGVAALAA